MGGRNGEDWRRESVGGGIDFADFEGLKEEEGKGGESEWGRGRGGMKRKRKETKVKEHNNSNKRKKKNLSEGLSNGLELFFGFFPLGILWIMSN